MTNDSSHFASIDTTSPPALAPPRVLRGTLEPEAVTPRLVAGRYCIEGRLASGSMGVLYDARHVTLGAPAIVKMIRPELLADDPARAEVLARFQSEYRVMARLRSPHVVRVFDAGVTADGCPFLVMEKLEGEDLERLLRRRGRLSPAQAASHVVQACLGLSELHSAGMVHRDVKPENLFLARHPSSPPTVKVLDLGLVKLGPRSEESTRRFAAAGRVLGSPAYLSPEQIEDPDSVDHRADVWSLGVVLVELLTGRCPFEEATVEASLERVRSTSAASLRRRLQGVDPGMVNVILRCLARNRERRSASMLDLANALRPFATPSCRSTLPPSPARPANRRRGSPAVFAGVFGLVLGASAASWSFGTPQGSSVRGAVARRAASISGTTGQLVQRAAQQARGAVGRWGGLSAGGQSAAPLSARGARRATVPPPEF